jgi:hypothetical protein
VKWVGEYKKRWGDRYDGRKLRAIDPFYKIIPYIMPGRVDSQNCFEDKIPLDAIEIYLKRKRKAGIRNISFFHIVIAALVRILSQKPALNRFIAGQKIYARNEILISFVLKKEMREDCPETTVKLKFLPTDTLFDVVDKVNKALKENRGIQSQNDTDQIARFVMMCPGFLVKFIVWLLKKMDYFGVMPKFIYEVSPFHTSIFITDLGSLGIQPVYHHLYEFGTTSLFIAFGAKQRERVTDGEGNIKVKKCISLKIVSDERIVDGYYYASAFKYFRSLLNNPEKLEAPPKKVVEDIE